MQLDKTTRGRVRIGSWAVVCGWSLLAVLMTYVVCMPIMHIHGRRPILVLFALLGLFMTAAFVYVAMAQIARCPNCGFQFICSWRPIGRKEMSTYRQNVRERKVRPWCFQVVEVTRNRPVQCAICLQKYETDA